MGSNKCVKCLKGFAGVIRSFDTFGIPVQFYFKGYF